MSGLLETTLINNSCVGNFQLLPPPQLFATAYPARDHRLQFLPHNLARKLITQFCTMCGTENGENGSTGVAPHPASDHNPATSIYSRVQDYLSNTGSYKQVRFSIAVAFDLTDNRIIESTLREGEQFSNAFFTREHKVKIATMLRCVLVLLDPLRPGSLY